MIEADPLAASNFTCRVVSRVTLGGTSIQIRLSNAFVATPTTFSAVGVAQRASGGNLVPGTSQYATFGGNTSVTVPAGGQVTSDSINMPVKAGEDLAVSVYFAGSVTSFPTHPVGMVGNYCTSFAGSAGDRTQDVGVGAYPGRGTNVPWVTGVDVSATTNESSIVALGDSITDGFAATVDGFNRWPDVLSRRLQSSGDGSHLSVINAGISGNNLVQSGGVGPTGVTRFSGDVVAQKGARYTILFEGTNDIANGASAATVEAGLQQLITAGHTAGLKVIGATLIGRRGGWGGGDDTKDAIRNAVNQWIRTTTAFDGVIDFDAVTHNTNPNYPTTGAPSYQNYIAAAYNSGDFVHPSLAGYAAMGNSIDLRLFDVNVLYNSASPAEGLAYNRVIRLAHSGSANGTLLATFEHPSTYVIRQSTNDGQTWSTLATVPDGETGSGHPWSTLYQPFLYEFPQTLGGFPAGTLMLTGNVLPPDGSSTHFEEWRSTDHGATWTYVETYQIGGSGAGIWEPYVALNSAGNMVVYFSDERQGATHSQKLSHIISVDGGVTWSANTDGSTRVAPGEVDDVSSGLQSDRPGMATIANLPNGNRVMAFELCGTTHNCEAHIKTSTDGGNTWGSGPADLGTEVTTTDGRYLGSSPYIAWSPAGGPSGELLLTGMRTRMASDNSFAPEDHQAVFINTNNGTGAWNWMPAPINVGGAGPSGSCYQNYSPDLLPSSDGQTVRYTGASASGPGGCREMTGSSNAGVLPYRSNFGASDAAWLKYGGCWSTSSNTYLESCGGAGGNKALVGSTGWTNYTLQGDVEITSGTQAGFILRATNPTTGTDALNGYYAAVSTSTLFLGRENGGWTGLGSVAIPGGLATNVWYHISAQVVGCTFVISGTPSGSSAPPVTFSYTDSGCTFTHGAVGVRDQGSTAAWRNITVSSTQRVEAESLLPALSSSAPAVNQVNCCGVTWSAGAQMFFEGAHAGDQVSLNFTVPSAGTYDLATVQTKAVDYGINSLAVDGHPIGTAFDAYNPTVAVSAPIDEGPLTLAAGQHTLQLNVTGKNASATGYQAGLDYINLTALAYSTVEAESLLPAISSSAPSVNESNCCGVNWSARAQMFFKGTQVGDQVTLAFTVPATGMYDLSLAETKAVDYGINQLAVDGVAMGAAFDAYNSTVAVTAPIDEGPLTLTAGQHTLQLTIIGKNGSATGYQAGLDYVNLSPIPLL
ncbi:GDSL-type esterase/lipase family protein [Kribbella kalugense]|nr:GDSL-type esterase/lipase family protein [Kribbella kalugense]